MITKNGSQDAKTADTPQKTQFGGAASALPNSYTGHRATHGSVSPFITITLTFIKRLTNQPDVAPQFLPYH